MLEDLEIGEAQAVEPERLARKTEELPPAIAKAWDETPVGEAKRIAVKTHGRIGNADVIDIEGARQKMGNALLRLLTLRAKGQGLMAFKASYTLTEEGLSLYWQKKQARGYKPLPEILPMPSPETAEHVEFLKEGLKKGRRAAPATDELRNE